MTLETAGKHEFLAPIHLQYVLEDKFILEKCECIQVSSLKKRLAETNNEKKYGDTHKILIENNINKVLIYSDCKITGKYTIFGKGSKQFLSVQSPKNTK